MTPEEAARRYHWVKYNSTTNTVELYLDNYMLSGLRICEAKFYLDHLLNLKPKYTEQGQTDNGKVIRKPWFFDFGEYIHWCLEQFYTYMKKNNGKAPTVDSWIDECRMRWAVMRMDEYVNSISKSDVKKYEEVKGWEGVAGLLISYYAYYLDMRLRIIDTEITFGHNKEVKIGQFDVNYWDSPIQQDYGTFKIECYLTGRIDLLVDNGYKIGPVDHKTTHRFDGNEHLDFNPHDGICGYIYAIHELLNKYREQGITNIPLSCSGGWIYHISACSPSTPQDKSKKPGPRFKSTPIDKSIIQLEDYKARQLSSYKRIAELLFNNKVPEWNTTACNYMFFRTCEFKPIHEQPSDQWEHIIKQFYTIGEAWDTRKH